MASDLVAARQEAQGADIPKPTGDDIKQWEFQVDQLSERILWDVDYESEDLFVDFSPEKSEWMKQKSESTMRPIRINSQHLKAFMCIRFFFP